MCADRGIRFEGPNCSGFGRVLAQKNGKKAEEVGHVTKTRRGMKQILTPEPICGHAPARN